jgi:hypothetical protein
MKRWLAGLVALLLTISVSVASARWYAVPSGPLHLDPPTNMTADERTVYDLAEKAISRGSAWGTPKLVGGYYVITDFATYRSLPPRISLGNLRPAADDRIAILVVGGEFWPARHMAAASRTPMPTTTFSIQYDLTLGAPILSSLGSGRPFTNDGGQYLAQWGTPVALQVSRD